MDLLCVNFTCFRLNKQRSILHVTIKQITLLRFGVFLILGCNEKHQVRACDLAGPCTADYCRGCCCVCGVGGGDILSSLVSHPSCFARL